MRIVHADGSRSRTLREIFDAVSAVINNGGRAKIRYPWGEGVGGGAAGYIGPAAFQPLRTALKTVHPISRPTRPLPPPPLFVLFLEEVKLEFERTEAAISIPFNRRNIRELLIREEGLCWIVPSVFNRTWMVVEGRRGGEEAR